MANAESASAFIDGNGRVRDEGEVPDFVDLIPDKPLLQALYSRRHAFELIEGTGWRVESLNPPSPNTSSTTSCAARANRCRAWARGEYDQSSRRSDPTVIRGCSSAG